MQSSWYLKLETAVVLDMKPQFPQSGAELSVAFTLLCASDPRASGRSWVQGATAGQARPPRTRLSRLHPSLCPQWRWRARECSQERGPGEHPQSVSYQGDHAPLCFCHSCLACYTHRGKETFHASGLPAFQERKAYE